MSKSVNEVFPQGKQMAIERARKMLDMVAEEYEGDDDIILWHALADLLAYSRSKGLDFEDNVFDLLQNCSAFLD